MLTEVVAHGAVRRLNQESFPLLVAPPVAYGSSAHHLPFGGTLSLTTETLLRVLLELGRSAAASGFRRIFFLNGHGGNHELAELAARDLALELRIAVGAGSWWVMAREELLEVGAGRVTTIPGHAGAFETAAVLAAAGKLVKSDLPARLESPPTRASNPRFRTEVHGSWRAIDGFSDSPADASAELGAAFLEAAIGRVADDLRSFYRSTEGQLGE
jgi:creatinine amidohydrolase